MCRAVFCIFLLAWVLASGGCSRIPPPPTHDMVFIPAGEFLMGSEVGFKDEQPAHLVFLDGFWIDKTEVTNEQYSRCVQAGACEGPSVTDAFADPAYANHPVVAVSWRDAHTYCAWASLRLPTEAEWEKAASWDPKTNTKRLYPWGDEFDCAKGNFGELSCDGYEGPSYEGTSPVGSFPSGASAYGALDMSGNVWEWVNDAFLETDPFGERENYYAVSPYSNPQGIDPAVSDYRVMRGGAWTMNFGGGRSTYRLWFGLDDAYNFVGFRCARTGETSGGGATPGP